MVKYKFPKKKKSSLHVNIKCAHMKDFIQFIKGKKVRSYDQFKEHLVKLSVYRKCSKDISG